MWFFETIVQPNRGRCVKLKLSCAAIKYRSPTKTQIGKTSELIISRKRMNCHT
jgi:hypothetical protein